MIRSVVILCTLLTLCAGCAVKSSESAPLLLDHKRDAQSLAGSWGLLLEHGDEEMWRPQEQAESLPWKAVDVPGSNLLRPDDPSKAGAGKAVQELAKETACVWIRRRFTVTAERASRDAVLKWGGIRFGATAWINGTLLGHHPTVGPNTALVPRGTLREGENEIVLKVLGWNGVPKSASGYPLIPVGGATQNWGGKGPAVYQDIWLEFYSRVYLRHVLAMPNVSDGTVTFRITLDGAGQLPAAVDVDAMVFGQESTRSTAVGAVQGFVVRGDRPTVEITCQLRSPQLWTPERPYLYRAHVTVGDTRRLCDAVSLDFGMRQVTVEDGHFRLNGQPLWLRGSNLVNEWLWGEKFDKNAKQYIIDEARSMNLNCFRTHTQPPTTKWLDIADQHGMMILAEFPLLYNHADFKYTPEEYEILHRNAMIDAEGWITKLWNHPSVVMWVLSNESRHDNEWESGPYYRHAKTLDPTRLCMRTGEVKVGTPDIADQHTCFNVVRGAEGQLIIDMTNLMADKDPERPLTNTEYMNHMWDPSARYLGSEKHADMPLEYAGIATEHTEAMRRLAFDCLLPYMYAGWARLRGAMNWRDDYPTPMAAALHSSMAPVLASLDLFDPNHVAGDTLDVPIMLINETHGEVSGKLDLYVTPRHPLYVPDAKALAAAVWHESQDVAFAADSMRRITVKVPVPQEEGSYYLAAVVTRKGDEPVVSQRVFRAVNPAKHAAALKGRRVVVLGADESVRAFLKRHECEVVEGLMGGRVGGDVVLVVDAARLSDAERQAATGPLRAFAESGGRIVVLDQTKWEWKELADCVIGLPEFAWSNPVICSRAHAHEGVEHAMLRDIPKDWLWRWNGLPGEIVDEVVMEGPALEQGTKLLWASKQDYTAALSVPVGKGEIVLSQLHIRRRIDPAGEAYDPVAERVLVNLLAP